MLPAHQPLVHSLTRYTALAALAVLGRAQTPTAALKANDAAPAARKVVLNITAHDGKGHAVTNLTSADFQILADGVARPIDSFHAAAAPPTTLILFDLLNTVRSRREFTAGLVVKALQKLETNGSVYLYLLTNYGTVYPVHGVPIGRGKPAGTPGDATWVTQIRPLLDRAIHNVYGLRPMDGQDAGIRAGTTFHALGDLGLQLADIPQPKTMVWITRGVPNSLEYPYGCKEVLFPEGPGTYLAGTCQADCTRFRDGKCIDYTPFLRHFSAQIAQTGTVIYSVEQTAEGSLPPSDRGTPSDTLQRLADLTGGRVYTQDVGKAIKESLEDGRGRYQATFDAPAADGKYHKLRVSCTQPGVRIDSPRGFLADPPERRP